MLDTKALAAATATIVREHMERLLAPVLAENVALAERISVLEARQPEKGEPGLDGAPGAAGKDADPEAIRSMVEEVVSSTLSEAVASLPPAEPGPQGEPGLPGERGAPGNDGKDADPTAIRALIEEVVDKSVARAVAALPAAERGIQGEAGPQGERGADGSGIADLLIDRSGELVATFTDGRMKNLGVIVGKDGSDGAPGADGADGRSVDPADFNMTLLEDGRTLRIGIGREGDETEYAFQIGFPVPIDRGDFEQGRAYEEGDIVTFDAGLWIAQTDTKAAPGSDDWRLCVPKGHPGAAAYPGMALGLFDPDTEYRAMDVVSFNGCEWRAKTDNPGPIPGEGWMLSAGKGKRGDRGERGAPGQSGQTIVASYVDVHRMKHVITLDNGAELEADLTAFARAIAQSNEGGLVG